MSNLYDNVCFNIGEAHQDLVRKDSQPLQKRSKVVTAVLLKTGLWQRLIESGFIQDWFDEFNRYWTTCLSCRPLNLHDFFYLYSHYRIKFQSVEVADSANAQQSLEAWQQPENIYLCFATAYHNALNPLNRYTKYINHAHHVLEYGCGAAPITYSAIKYSNLINTKFTIADIPQFTYHFAKWRLGSYQNVEFCDILPDVIPNFPIKFDAVFLLTVLEHLNNPLEVITNITNHIENGGYLIFDYIKSVGHGLDTIQSQRERSAVLEFISKHFKVVEGKLDKDKSMGCTIVRKL